MVTPSYNRLALVVERLYPYAIGMASASCVWAGYSHLPSINALLDIDPKLLITAIFACAVMFTGLLFSVYILAVVPTGGFVERIAGTKTFDGFRNYVIQALVTGVLLVLVSLPYQSAKSVKFGEGVWSRSGLAILSFFTAVAVLTLFRASHIFIVLSRVATKRH